MFQQSFGAGDIVVAATIYSNDFNALLNVTNNYTDVGVVSNIPQGLFPLVPSEDPPKGLITENGLIRGPFLVYDMYLLSITIPILNTTVSDGAHNLSGYLTVALECEMLLNIFNDTTGTDNNFQYSLLGPYPNNVTNPSSYVYLLPPQDYPDLFRENFSFDTFPAAGLALQQNQTGSYTDSFNSYEKDIAIGFTVADVIFIDWAVTVVTTKQDLYQPIYHLRNIALATVFSLAAFMCLITLPITHFAVRPIVRLRAAAEKTTSSYYSDTSDDEGSVVLPSRTSDAIGDGQTVAAFEVVAVSIVTKVSGYPVWWFKGETRYFRTNLLISRQNLTI